MLAADSGGDFAPEATRLGEALREVHETLRTHFPAETRPASAAAELAAQMTDRLAAAATVVPGLAAARRRAALGVRPGRAPRRAGRPADPRRPAPRARPCGRRRAGRSSTSRASRPSPWPSGSAPTPRGATSPGCCAASTTHPGSSSAPCPRANGPRTRPVLREGGRAMGRTQQEPLPRRLRRWGSDLAATDLAGRLRRGQSRLRDRLRDPQPPDLARGSRSRPWRRSEQHEHPAHPRRPRPPCARSRRRS